MKELSTAALERLQHLKRVRTEFRPRSLRGKSEPHRKVVTEKERHGVGTVRGRWPPIPQWWDVEPSPTDAAREAELIEPMGTVLLDARSEHLRFPRGGWQLIAIEQLEHGFEPIRTFG